MRSIIIGGKFASGPRLRFTRNTSLYSSIMFPSSECTSSEEPFFGRFRGVVNRTFLLGMAVLTEIRPIRSITLSCSSAPPLEWNTLPQ